MPHRQPSFSIAGVNSTPPLPVSTPSKRSFAGSALLFGLVFACLAAVAWFGWRDWQRQLATQAEQAAQQRAALDARMDSLQQHLRAQAQRLQQAEATNRVLRDELLGLGQRAGLIEDSLSQLTDPNRHGAQALHLDEIELLLSIGQQRLQLDDDVDGARRALALAAPLLARIDDPAYLSLRQTLLQEQAALEALGADPRIRANTLLNQLPQGVRAQPPAPATLDPQAPWYARLLDRIVQRQPTASAGLHELADRETALAALQIELSLARGAIQRRDAAQFQQALKRIDQWLRRLVLDPAQQRAKQQVLAQLRALDLQPATAVSGSTLTQLRTLRGDRRSHLPEHAP